MTETIRVWCEMCRGGTCWIFNPDSVTQKCPACSGLGYIPREIPSAELAEIGRLGVAISLSDRTVTHFPPIHRETLFVRHAQAVHAYLAKQQGGKDA